MRNREFFCIFLRKRDKGKSVCKKSLFTQGGFLRKEEENLAKKKK